ncbi:MAG: hypothetical protein MZV70_36530 [Desulfobacterales bacterium]|nr:hypothetical protein [Desulfobacterales bacterium]
MDHWKKNQVLNLVGIGVDEITALAINHDGMPLPMVPGQLISSGFEIIRILALVP